MPSWSSGPFSVCGKAGNLVRRFPGLRLGRPFRFFKPLGASLRAMPLEALFHASCALGVRPSGCSQFQRAAILLGLALPSWRYFQALFPSEERKTTKSSDFRALTPPETADSHTLRYISLSPSWLFRPSRVFDPSYYAVRTSPARPSRTHTAATP